jgi:hypothetical protein
VPHVKVAMIGAAGVSRSHAPHGVGPGVRVSVYAGAGELAAWYGLSGSTAWGLFALSMRDDKAVVTPADAKDATADVSRNVAALGSLDLGGVGVDTLARSGQVTATSRAAWTRSAPCSATVSSPTASPLSSAPALARKP